jgi:glyoxylase I family protein
VRSINRIVLLLDEEKSMPKAIGIGGVFFRAANPAGLAEWYQKHLGIDDLHKSVWQQEAGMTIFGPFPNDSDYFGRAEQQWMINFRVDDLDGLVANLTANEVLVETRNEWNSEVGRFARIHDPEGNPVELWEPSQDS